MPIFLEKRQPITTSQNYRAIFRAKIHPLWWHVVAAATILQDIVFFGKICSTYAILVQDYPFCSIQLPKLSQFTSSESVKNVKEHPKEGSYHIANITYKFDAWYHWKWAKASPCDAMLLLLSWVERVQSPHFASCSFFAILGQGFPKGHAPLCTNVIQIWWTVGDIIPMLLS